MGFFVELKAFAENAFQLSFLISTKLINFLLQAASQTADANGAPAVTSSPATSAPAAIAGPLETLACDIESLVARANALGASCVPFSLPRPACYSAWFGTDDSRRRTTSSTPINPYRDT
jgi:hypothetical protein